MSLSPARPSWFQIKLQLCPVLRIPNFIQLPPGREVQSILRNLLSPGQMYFISTNNIIWVLQFCVLSFFESVNYFEPFSLFKILRTHHYKSFTALNLCKPSTSLKGNWAMAKKLTQIVPKKILPKRNCLSPQNILQPATQQQWKSCLGKIFSWGRQIIQSPLWETVPEVGKKLRDGSIRWECMKYLEAVSPSMRYTQSSCKTAQTCGRTIKPIIKNSSFVK